MTEHQVSNQTVDIAIITVRQDEERAILARMPERWTRQCQRQIYSLATIPVAGSTRTVAVARCSEEGQAEAQNVARDIIEDLNPRTIFVVGIGGGFPSRDFSLGDVVVATRVQDLRIMAVVEGQAPQLDVRGTPVAGEVRRVIGALEHINLGDWNSFASIGLVQPSVALGAQALYGPRDWQDEVRGILVERFGPDGTRQREPRFVTGAVVSTDVLVKRVAPVRHWKGFIRKAVACEMELAAVVQAANQPGHTYPVYGIRGISDVIGLRRSDAWTSYACATAAAFAFALIRTGFVPPDDSAHRERRPTGITLTVNSPKAGSDADNPSTDSVRHGELFQPAVGFVDRGDLESAVATILQGRSFDRAEPHAQLSVVGIYQKFGFIEEAWQYYEAITSRRNIARLTPQQQAWCSVIELKLLSQTPDLMRVRDGYEAVLEQMSEAGLDRHRAAVYRRAAVAHIALGDTRMTKACVAQGRSIDARSRDEHSRATGAVFEAITLILGTGDGRVLEALETLKAAPCVYLSSKLDRSVFHAHPLKSAVMCLFAEAAVRFVSIGENPATWVCLTAAHILGGVGSARPQAEGYAELLSLLRRHEKYWEILRKAMGREAGQRRDFYRDYPAVGQHLAACQELPDMLQPATDDAWRAMRVRLDKRMADSV